MGTTDMAALRLLLLLIKDVGKDLLRHRGQYAFAVMTLASGLLLAGGGLMVVEALDRWVGRMESQARVVVFAAEGAQLEPTAQSLRRDPRIKTVKRVSSEEATRRFLAISRDAGLMLQGLGGESIPENLELILQPEFAAAQRAIDVGDSLRALPGVGYVVVDQERMQAFQRVARLARSAMGFFGIVLMLAAAFSTGNVIRMIILTREEEITIMRLVGATETYIRTPLVLQGAVLGFAASVSAILLLYGIWLPLHRGVWQLPPVLLDMLRLGFFSIKSQSTLILLGTATGAFGAWWGFIATRKAQRARAQQIEETSTA